MSNSVTYDYSGCKVLVTGGTSGIGYGIAGAFAQAGALNGGASIIGIASLTSFFAHDMLPGYGAAKAGLVQMAKTLGLAWAQHGIRANNIAAGLTETRMTGPMKDIPGFNEQIIDRTPLKRWGSPADMAGAVLFLCSEQASFITGETLLLDGGYTLGI